MNSAHLIIWASFTYVFIFPEQFSISELLQEANGFLHGSVLPLSIHIHQSTATSVHTAVFVLPNILERTSLLRFPYAVFVHYFMWQCLIRFLGVVFVCFFLPFPPVGLKVFHQTRQWYSESVWAAIRNCYLLGYINNRNLFPTVLKEVWDQRASMIGFWWEPVSWMVDGYLITISWHGREQRKWKQVTWLF